MKPLALFVFIGCCFSSIHSFAQTPKQIEADLSRSFKRIDFWEDKSHTDTTGNLAYEDSLESADDVFAKKLKNYTVKYPGTINQPFYDLKKEQIDIFTSDDGLFRIYSWDTWLGGTMHDFANILQYKSGNSVASIYIHSDGSDAQSYTPFYTKLYTFKVNQKTYYLGVYGCIYSTKDVGNGIKIFDVENGKLNQNVKIIKTASGMHGQLYYDFDFFSIVNIDFDKRPTIYFDSSKQTIHVPLVASNGDVTHQYITYKFTGKYFEKVN